MRKKGAVSGAGVGFAFMFQLAPGNRNPETVRGEPFEPGHGLVPAQAPLGLVNLAGVVIEADPDRQPLAPFKRQQGRLGPAHRLHRVGQHQHLEPAGEAQLQDRQHVGIHERLATGEGDLAGRQAFARDLVEEGLDLGQRQIDQRIIARRALDVAGGAGQIAQRAGVEPQRVQPGQRHLRARLAPGGHAGVFELAGRERPGGCQGEGRNYGGHGGNSFHLGKRLHKTRMIAFCCNGMALHSE